MTGFTPNQSFPYPEYTDPADEAGQLKALADAVNASLLSIQATAATAVSRIGAFCTGSVVQSIPNAGATNMTFDVEQFDTANCFNLGVNNTDAIFTVAGIYLIYGKVRFATNATGDRNVRFQKNAAIISNGANSRAITAGVETEHVVWELVSVVPGDAIRLQAAQSSAGNLNVDTKQFGLVRVSG